MIAKNRDTIYFSDDWVLPKYHKWVALVKEENVVVLIKHASALSKILVLSCDMDAQDVDGVLNKIPYNKIMTQIYWRDFTDVASEDLRMSSRTTDSVQIRIGGRWYKKATDRNKLIHWATFIINLEKEIDEIMSDMSSTVRNECRRAQKRGAVVTLESTIGEWIEDFYDFYRRLQAEFSLVPPDRKIVEEMIAGKNAVAVIGHDSCGVSAVNIIYLAPPHAYYMLGASSNSKERGLGQLMQLETINYLKSKGFKKYDLGGVNQAQPGILAFKKSLGGDFYELGSEWIYTPRVIDILLRLRFLMTRLRSALVLTARFS
jgi:hypothetical protein